LVEHQLPKLNVAGSSPVARSSHFYGDFAMMKKITLAVMGLLLFTSPALAASPVGVWVTKGGKSHVQIYNCGTKLCGKIIWLKVPKNPDGTDKVDKKNPDQAKRSQKIVGLSILWGFKKDDDNEWSSGRIYNPQDGDVYKCNMELKDAQTLRVRGYVGVSLFGKTQIWKRVR
jgi:uncharacterized protein (DUF2147 family)